MVGNFFAQILQIGVFLYVARVLGPMELGILSFVLVLNQFLAYVPLFALPPFGVRALTVSRAHLVETVSLVSLMRFGLSFFAAIVIGFLAISTFLRPLRLLLLFAVANLPLALMLDWVLNALGHVRLQVMSQLLQRGTFGLLGILLLHLTHRLEVLPAALFVSGGLGAIVCQGAVRRVTGSVKLFRLKSIRWRNSTKSALHFGTSGLLFMTQMSLNVPLLYWLQDQAAVGHHAVASKISYSLLLLVWLTCQGLLPIVCEVVANPERDATRFIWQVMKAVFLLLLPLVGFGAFFGTAIVGVFGEQYTIPQTVAAFQLYMVYLLIAGVNYTFLLCILPAVHQERVGVWANATGAGIGFVVHWSLIQKYGYVGAALADLVVQAIVAWIAFGFSGVGYRMWQALRRDLGACRQLLGSAGN